MRRPLLALVALSLFARAAWAQDEEEPKVPQAGEPAPEFAAEVWFNHIGESPTLESMRGQALLLEFWATW